MVQLYYDLANWVMITPCKHSESLTPLGTTLVGSRIPGCTRQQYQTFLRNGQNNELSKRAGRKKSTNCLELWTFQPVIRLIIFCYYWCSWLLLNFGLCCQQDTLLKICQQLKETNSVHTKHYWSHSWLLESKEQKGLPALFPFASDFAHGTSVQHNSTMWGSMATSL